MKSKSQPMRTCVGCGEPKSKRELIRVALSPEGIISIDKTGRRLAAVRIFVLLWIACKQLIKVRN